MSFEIINQKSKTLFLIKSERDKERNPSGDSALIGRDEILMLIVQVNLNRTIPKKDKTSLIHKNNQTPVKNKSRNRAFRCPSLPGQWKNNIDLIIPKAEFGAFIPKRILSTN